MVTASNEERIARLEAGYEHLATKEDLAQLETRLLFATTQRIDRLFWAVLGIGGGLLAAAVAAVAALIRVALG